MVRENTFTISRKMINRKIKFDVVYVPASRDSRSAVLGNTLNTIRMPDTNTQNTESSIWALDWRIFRIIMAVVSKDAAISTILSINVISHSSSNSYSWSAAAPSLWEDAGRPFPAGSPRT